MSLFVGGEYVGLLVTVVIPRVVLDVRGTVWRRLLGVLVSLRARDRLARGLFIMRVGLLGVSSFAIVAVVGIRPVLCLDCPRLVGVLDSLRVRDCLARGWLILRVGLLGISSFAVAVVGVLPVLCLGCPRLVGVLISLRPCDCLARVLFIMRVGLPGVSSFAIVVAVVGVRPVLCIGCPQLVFIREVVGHGHGSQWAIALPVGVHVRGVVIGFVDDEMSRA